jgi:(p)ppGpp synthase/HD superfamily hydrolase
VTGQAIKNIIIEICGIENADIEDALATANLAHLGQTRRDKSPYITHPLAVADIVNSYYPEDPTLCAAALLHDTIEDAPNLGNVKSAREMASLIAGSFGNPEIGNRALEIVKLLTHNRGIQYDEYLINLSSNQDALRIKLADMLHNVMTSPSDRQLAKYQNALLALKDYYQGTPPGIDSGHWKSLESATKVKLSETVIRRFIYNTLKEIYDV